MVDCTEFLEEYSDYRDGVMTPSRAAEYRAHLEECPSCARYDSVVAGGVEVFRALPTLEPSSDFLPRLQHRIYQSDYEASKRRTRASGASVMVVSGIALAIAAAAWAPVLDRRPAPVLELPPIAAHAPHRVEPMQVLFRPGPLLTERTPRPVLGRSTVFYEYSQMESFASSPLRAP